MSNQPRRSLETKRALFWAALAAQCADETYVTRNRIVASLLKTASVEEFCSRMRIDVERIREAVEDPGILSFAECERRVRDELAEIGIELGSTEHFARVKLRPIDPAVREIFDVVLVRQGHVAVSPTELLLQLIRADPALARLFAHHGLTVDVIVNALRDG
jgi:hypothetical protein